MTHSEITHSSTHSDITQLSQKIVDYDELGYTEHMLLDIENDIDPDKNFFSNIKDNSYYYTDEQYKQSIKSDGKLSIIHFNSRSKYVNFKHIKEYLHQCTHPFNIIAISETWINIDKGVDFELDVHEFNYMNRKNKSGGGVAI